MYAVKYLCSRFAFHSRNHYIDKGFVLPSGSVFVKKDLEDLLYVDRVENEYRCQWKLLKDHFDVKGAARQRVYLAAELFSNKSANLLEWAHEKNPDQKQDQVGFIKLIDMWWSIFNSKVMTDHKNPIKSAYGTRPEHDDILDEFQEVIKQMRAIGKKPNSKLIPFQRGMWMSCKALKELLKRLNERYPEIFFIRTVTVNQGCQSFRNVSLLSNSTFVSHFNCFKENQVHV